MVPYFLILLAFVADRLSKQWVDANLDGPLRVNQYLTLSKTYNEGIAFGLFQGSAALVGWFTLFVVFGLFFYLLQTPREEWLARAGLGLIIGGALGNMIDRILVGRVLDFFVTPLRAGIFNVADVAINVGMVLVIIGTFWPRKRPSPPHAAESVPADETADDERP